MSRIRVLVVDDSAFARKVVRECLERSEHIEVVDIARDGLEAVEKVSVLRPDVITLDLVMPNLDGLGVLRALQGAASPRVVLVSMSDASSDLAVDALALGALDLVHKPTALATNRLYEMADELIAKVLAAGAARPGGAARTIAARPAPLRTPSTSRRRLVAIGASTGGPQAVTALLSALPGDLSVPVAVVLHLPVEYTAAFARRLSEQTAFDVVEASDGLELRPGMVAIARGGIHLRVERDGRKLVAVLDPGPVATHRPSVDVLFESVASALGPAALAVVLTGMGRDGTAGARAIRDAGGAVLTEAESSCIVYGMPRAVREADLSTAEAPIDEMAALVLSHL
jgi:two-component system, chemotaxis family, protein-glutamate methylesterase/glutaminase